MANTFEHRHYKLLADIIAKLPEDSKATLANIFADSLKGTNPRYNRERFVAAAMGTPSNGRDKVS